MNDTAGITDYNAMAGNIFVNKCVRRNQYIVANGHPSSDCRIYPYIHRVSNFWSSRTLPCTDSNCGSLHHGYIIAEFGKGRNRDVIRVDHQKAFPNFGIGIYLNTVLSAHSVQSELIV